MSLPTSFVSNIMQSQTPLRLVLNAAFIAVVSFGAVGGVLSAVFPETFFNLADQVICPAPAELKFESWYDGSTNQISVYCVNELKQQSRDQTLLALGVILGGIFLVIFWVAFIILLIIRAAQRKKYGV